MTWLAALALGGCGKRTRRTPDDTLVVLIEGKLDNLDPRFASTNNDVKFSRLVIPGLTTIDQTSLEPRPELAASVTQVDDVTWDVVLRGDLRFSDGSPVTADDVVYSYQSVLDPAVNSLHRGSFAERIRRIEATGPLGVRFHLVEPLATFLTDLDFGIFSAAADRRGQVLGAGAYRVLSFHGDRLLLERNPHYFGPPAAMPRIEARSVRDANARAIMLVGGSGDLTQNTLRMDLIDAVAGRARVYVDSGPGVILTYLMMQNEDPMLDDVRVRRAIAHAIDRERIVAVKMGGRAVLASGFLPPSHWAYHGDVATYPYDPERARQLLDEAGFPDPDGPGGAPRMRLGYKTSADQFRLAIARVIAAQLGEIGIEVEVRAYEFGTFFTDIKKGNYQIATMQSAPITDPDYYYTYFHSERVPDPTTLFGHNRWRYRNPRLDQLVEQGRRVADRQARLGLYAEVQEILARDLPVIPLWHEDNVVIMNVDVTDYQLLPSARFAGLRTVRKQDGP